LQSFSDRFRENFCARFRNVLGLQTALGRAPMRTHHGVDDGLA
jgi:hypothetical protein